MFSDVVDYVKDFQAWDEEESIRGSHLSISECMYYVWHV